MVIVLGMSFGIRVNLMYTCQLERRAAYVTGYP